MIRFVTLNCLVESAELHPFPSDVVQNLRQAILFPHRTKLAIQQALQRTNFQFHRQCSYSDLSQECSEGVGDALLIFWGCQRSESRFTVMSTSSSSSMHLSSKLQSSQRDRELRSTAQQTDISCRSPGLMSPGSPSEADELRARIASSLTQSSPASSLLHASGRSVSILSSVCALLLNKQGSPGVGSPKAAPASPAEASVPAASAAAAAAAAEGDICRICFGGESAARLVRPCACRGTVAAVHRACLERWLLQAAASRCELCRYHYQVTRTHKCGWAAAAAAWAASGRGRALWGDAWRGAALAAAGVAGTARALAACDALLQAGARRGGAAALAANLGSSLVVGAVGALNGLLTTWILLKIQEYQVSWREWRAGTLTLRVVLPGGDGDSDGDADAADADTANADTADTCVAVPRASPDQ